MGGNDIGVVAVALIIALTYGVFLFYYSNADTNEYGMNIPNATQFDTPDSGNFFQQLSNIASISVDNQEIFFVNIMLFGAIAFLLVMVGLRFLRGQ